MKTITLTVGHAVILYTHQQYEPRHNTSNCVRIRGDLSPLVCSLRIIMIETNHSPRDEANYNEYRKQAEKEINAKLKVEKKPEVNSLIELIIRLKAESDLLKESFKR